MASSSSNGSTSAAEDALQQAGEAAKQLSSLWKATQHARLLRRPPPDAAAAAASSDPAVQAMQSSMLLLHKLTAALAEVQRMLPSAGDAASRVTLEQLLHDLLTEQRLPQLLARLLMWLQQRPECLFTAKQGEALAGQAASAAAADGPSASVWFLWQHCMACLANLVSSLSSISESGSPPSIDLVRCFTQALAEAGEPGRPEQVPLYASKG